LLLFDVHYPLYLADDFLLYFHSAGKTIQFILLQYFISSKLLANDSPSRVRRKREIEGKGTPTGESELFYNTSLESDLTAFRR